MASPFPFNIHLAAFKQRLIVLWRLYIDLHEPNVVWVIPLIWMSLSEYSWGRSFSALHLKIKMRSPFISCLALMVWGLERNIASVYSSFFVKKKKIIILLEWRIDLAWHKLLWQQALWSDAEQTVQSHTQDALFFFFFLALICNFPAFHGDFKNSTVAKSPSCHHIPLKAPFKY